MTDPSRLQLLSLPDWAALPPEIDTKQVAALIGQSEGYVRALVAERKKKAQAGAELTDADGLPAPRPHGKRRLHQTANVRRYMEARDAQKVTALALPLDPNELSAGGAEMSLRLPAFLRIIEQNEKLTDDLRKKDDDLRHKDSIIEAKDAEVQRLQTRVIELLEQAQKKRKWWQLFG